jgi:hypothetical protein
MWMAILFVLISALASVLANRGLSIFHDGLRPLIPDMRNGRIPQKQMSRHSFNLGFGFLWSYGIPFSVGLQIPLVFMIFMTTDWIGVSMPADHDKPWYSTSRSRKGVLGATVLGALWGLGLALILWLVYHAMRKAAVNLLDMTGHFSDFGFAAFILIPVLTFAYYHRVRTGILALLLGVAAWYAGANLAGDPAVWAFLVPTIALMAYLVYLVTRSADNETSGGNAPLSWTVMSAETDPEEEAFLRANVARLKRNVIPIATLYGLMGAAYNYGVMANHPIQGALYARGHVIAAVLIALAWAFAMLPMKTMTTVTSGAMSTGTYFEAAIAMLMPSPVYAFVALFVTRIIEVYALLPTQALFERHGVIREMADVMRTAIGHMMELALVVGAVVAAHLVLGPLAGAAVIAAVWLNRRADSPVSPISIGAWGAVAAGAVAAAAAAVGLSAT